MLPNLLNTEPWETLTDVIDKIGNQKKTKYELLYEFMAINPESRLSLLSPVFFVASEIILQLEGHINDSFCMPSRKYPQYIYLGVDIDISNDELDGVKSILHEVISTFNSMHHCLSVRKFCNSWATGQIFLTLVNEEKNETNKRKRQRLQSDYQLSSSAVDDINILKDIDEFKMMRH